MQKLSLVAAVAAVLTLTACGGGGGGEGSVATPVVQAPTTLSTCADDASTSLLGQYIGSNNVWGKGSITDYSQCMTYTTGADIKGINATIDWRWPEGQGNVKAYPSIIYGRKPDTTSTGNAALPATLGTMPNLTANVDMTVSATGKYDVAFDMWMASDSVAGFNKNITHEVMIWLQSGSDVGNVGTLLETVTLSGVQFDVWVQPNFVVNGLKPWTMVVFRAKSTTTKASIQVKQFTDYMIAKGIATPQTYLADVEFGVEPISGSGKVVLNSYSVK